MLRDQDGNFIFGFASALGPGSVIEAELQAIRMGIQLARLKGFQNVEVDQILCRLFGLSKMVVHPVIRFST